MLANDRVDVGNLTLLELLGQLGQETRKLIVRRVAGLASKGAELHGHPA